MRRQRAQKNYLNDLVVQCRMGAVTTATTAQSSAIFVVKSSLVTWFGCQPSHLLILCEEMSNLKKKKTNFRRVSGLFLRRSTVSISLNKTALHPRELLSVVQL